MSYKEFLESKKLLAQPVGKDVDPGDLHPALFDFQRDLTSISVKRGRSAIFTDCGTGKAIMAMAWGQVMADRTLILAPLAVALQFVQESKKFNIPLTYARSMSDSPKHGITVTNYEMLKNFRLADYGAVVTDESGILKHFEGVLRTQIIEAVQAVPYRLACTATPAPNDILELGNHSEYVGNMSMAEMKAAFFVHDSSRSTAAGWRLKGHAHDAFYKWLVSWAAALRKPSDMGYDDGDFILPPLEVTNHFVDTTYIPEGQLFFTGLKGIQDRIAVRRATMDDRVALTTELMMSNDEQWCVWVGLNPEGQAIAKNVDDCVLIEGRHSPEEKAEMMMAWVNGDVRNMVTKTRIAGFGMNFQNCHNVIWCGMNDSAETWYQANRRFWRFGQDKQVNVHTIMADVEQEIWMNVNRKERESEKMIQSLVDEMRVYYG